MKRSGSLKLLLLLLVISLIFSNFLSIGYSNVVGIPNGLQVEHNYSTNQMPGETTPSTLTYTKPSNDIIHITNYLGGSIDDTGSWDVNASSRIISNQENFGPFNDDHSVFWIYTDVSLNDQIVMCNIWKGVHTGVGDTTFNITGEAMLDTMEVWVLEDAFGSELWYEKERGFMVNGTIIHGGDHNKYEFISAGVPVIPGYSFLLIIGIIATISIIIIKKRDIRK